MGAGIVGLTTALLAARDGMRVVVLEARRIGDGTTGYATGKVTAQHSLIYARLVAWAGVDRARQYADANRAGIDLVADLAELDIDCSPTRADALVYTTSDEATSIRAMEDEAVAAHRLALPATLVNESGCPSRSPPGALHRPAARAPASLPRRARGRPRRSRWHHPRAQPRDPRRRGARPGHGRHRRGRSRQPARWWPRSYRSVCSAATSRTRPSLSYGLAVRLRHEAPPT